MWVCGRPCPAVGVTDGWKKLGKIRVDVWGGINDKGEVEVMLQPQEFGAPD